MSEFPRRVFLCGIGGIGMANLAVLLKEAGFDVSGSDGAVYDPAATILRERAIPVVSPYSADNVPRDGTPIILGNALSRGHPEVEAALSLRVPLYSFPDFLHREILQRRETVVVAGTHGKSTTTACIAHLLQTAGVRPGFLVGALPLNFSAGAQWGHSDAPFVVEGDEYDSAFFDKRSKFLSYFPSILVLGTVEYDHADIFPTEGDMLLAYRRLIRLLPNSGTLIYYDDCAATRGLAAEAPCRTITVGTSHAANWCLMSSSADYLSFRNPSGQCEKWAIASLGFHNRLNALMSIAATQCLTEDMQALREGIQTFRGLRRRMEILFRKERLVVIDDFAHHPTAIRSTIQAVRESFPAYRIIAVVEPRSNTMVRNVFQGALTEALAFADEALVGTIHRRERIPEGERLDADKLARDLAACGTSASHVGNFNMASRLKQNLDERPTAVVLMSNGSFDGVPQQFVRLMQE